MDKATQEGFAKLEAQIQTQSQTIATLTTAIANLIGEYSSLKQELEGLIDDVEIDGKSESKSILELQRGIVKALRLIYALDAKNTSVATVVCRELGLPPDVMLAEYNRVVSDFGTVDKLIDTTKSDPTKD